MGWLALTDENGKDTGVSGDVPWDIMGNALQEIVKVYEETWGRKPTLDELEYAFEFTLPMYLRD